MVKLVQFMVRDEGYDHEEFVERWQGEHAGMAAELPGLQYDSTGVPTDPEKAAYDGGLELGFEDTDATAFVDMDATERMIVEETVHVDR